MSATDFVQPLFDGGRVRVTSWHELPTNFAEAVRFLDEQARPEMPYDPPPLDADAAGWALRLMYRAAQALIYRELDADAVRDMLAEPAPGQTPGRRQSTGSPASRSPAVCYSVDLSFRLLPDLISLARGLSEDDPLVTALMSLAAAWPLSSVGVKGLGEVDPSAFIGDRSLRRLYADRIIDKADASRLSHPAAKQAVVEALGAHPELAPPAIAAALAGTTASR